MSRTIKIAWRGTVELYLEVKVADRISDEEIQDFREETLNGGVNEAVKELLEDELVLNENENNRISLKDTNVCFWVDEGDSNV